MINLYAPDGRLVASVLSEAAHAAVVRLFEPAKVTTDSYIAYLREISERRKR